MLFGLQKFSDFVDVCVYIAENVINTPQKGVEICKNLGLPPRHFEKHFQELVRRKILKSVRGPHGGYLLATERRKVSLHMLYEVFYSIENKDPIEVSVSIAKAITNIEDFASQELKSVSLENICKSKQNSVDMPTNFTI